MRRLLSLIVAMCLFASLANGAILRAAELSEPAEVTEATLWLHADCGTEHAPPDEHNNYPHHHNACHGHELAAPGKLTAAPLAMAREPAPLPAHDAFIATGPPVAMLRPPIA